MFYYDDIVSQLSANYTLPYPIDYPGIGPLDTATKQPVAQPDNEPFIKIYISGGGTDNAVVLTGPQVLKREDFMLAVEILTPRTTATSPVVYTPSFVATVEAHLDSFMVFQSINTNDGGTIYSATDRPKFKVNSQARNDDHFTSTVIQYNYVYQYCNN